MIEALMKFAENFKSPVVFSVIAAMIITLAWLTKDHVSVSDIQALSAKFEGLQAQLAGVQWTLKYDHADSELHKIESDLFILNQHVEEEHAKSHEVDRLYAERINELNIRHEELMRKISSMDAQGKVDR